MMDGRPRPHLRRDLPEGRPLRLGQHEVVPAGGGLDARREIVEPRPGLHAAFVPDRRQRVAVSRAGRRCGDPGDRRRLEVEVGDERVDAAVDRRRGRAERADPQVPLLVVGRPLDVDPRPGPVEPGERLAPRRQHRRVQPVDEALDRRHAQRVAIAVAGFHHQHGTAQRGLARTQPRERLVLCRQRVGPHDEESEAEPARGGGGDCAPGGRVGTAQRRSRGRVGRVDPVCHARGGRGLRRGERSGGGGLDETVEPHVEVVDARQVMEDPLVDPERARGHRARVGELDELPAAQRRRRRQRAPVRAVEGGECKAERREAASRVAVQRGAQVREGAVELHPGAQEQDVALERREPEDRGEGADRRVGRLGFACWRRLPLKRGPHARELADQRALVGLRPARHATFTLGPTNWLNCGSDASVSSSSALSAPSTRSWISCRPVGWSTGIRNRSVEVGSGAGAGGAGHTIVSSARPPSNRATRCDRPTAGATATSKSLPALDLDRIAVVVRELGRDLRDQREQAGVGLEAAVQRRLLAGRGRLPHAHVVDDVHDVRSGPQPAGQRLDDDLARRDPRRRRIRVAGREAHARVRRPQVAAGEDELVVHGDRRRRDRLDHRLRQRERVDARRPHRRRRTRGAAALDQHGGGLVRDREPVRLVQGRPQLRHVVGRLRQRAST